MAAVVSPSFLARIASRLWRAGVGLSFAACGAGAVAQAVKTPPAAGPAQAAPQLAFELVTRAEAARDRELRPKNETFDAPEVRTRSVPGAAAAAAPVFAIRVLAPTPQVAVTAPLRIELAFDAPPGARVVPSSFRVLYGVLKIDLTDRLRRFSTISERGVVVDQAVVPDGLHRLFLQVADDKGNVAEQELRLRVGVAS
jgi:hypothetical protein